MDEDLLPLELHAVFEPDVDLPLALNVPAQDLDFALWLDVPDPAGSDVGGLLLSVPYAP